ncbi:kinesin-like protein KIF25 [Festucalex cinctus]
MLFYRILLQEVGGNVRVHCRLRPLLPLDCVQTSPSGCGCCSSHEVIRAISHDTLAVECVKAGVAAHDKIFGFDRVHGPDESQEDVFKPLLGSLMDGRRDVCVLTYGQTGSGKTHTVLGWPESKRASGLREGLVVKAAAEIFRMMSDERRASRALEMSAVEVRNRHAVDLLAKDGGNVTSSAAASCQLTSLTHERVHDVAHLMLRLRADRLRCHLIVTLALTWCDPAGRHSPEDAVGSPSPASFRSKLRLVDLASSECAGERKFHPCLVLLGGTLDASAWEWSCIKRSVSALWDVVSALAERRTHVPYRNSKLTHLLKDAIGGDGELLVMLCVSPARRFLSESLQTLSFGARARQVRPHPAGKKSDHVK